MPDLELGKDEMEQREAEVFELSPMLEGDSHEVREDEALLPPGEQDERREEREVIAEDPLYTEPAPPPPGFAKIEYLDGLRGLASVWVFMQHLMPAYTLGGHEFGFGQDGQSDHDKFIQLPVVRLFFGNGGNAAVVIFFVLSGYVLSISSFRKLKQNKAPECRRALLSALIRRPIRLYVPPLAISFIYAMLLHVPGPLVLPLPWDGGRPAESIWAEIEFFTRKSYRYFSIFREHASTQFAFPYNAAMWTIPIELKGSLLVFGVVFVLSLGMHGDDHKVPLMAALMLFGAAAIMIQRDWKWSMASFLFGMVLALVDTWPIGKALKRPFTPPERVRELAGRMKPRWKIPDLRLKERWTGMWSRVTPRWLTKRFARSERLPKQQLETSRQPTLFHHICLWVGLYLLSQPSHAGDRTYTTHTPGWVFLSSLIPEEYDDARYYRYWQAWASILVVYAVLRIPYLQRFFSTRPLKFLGYVSFMLYLIHLNWFRILPNRTEALFGGFPDPHLEGSFWDRSWTVPLWGPYGIGLRFWVGLSVSLPSSLFVAWCFTKCVDTPSVKLGKWLTRVIGLDKPRPRGAETEGSGIVLPT